MFKKFSLLVALTFAFNSYAADTVAQAGDWTVEYNTGSAFYSAAKGTEEITMECLLGEMTFAGTIGETGEDFNSHDDKVLIVIDGTPYKAPVTLQERSNFYNAVRKAKGSIQYRTAAGFVSEVYSIRGLRALFNQVEFDLSDCKE